MAQGIEQVSKFIRDQKGTAPPLLPVGGLSYDKLLREKFSAMGPLRIRKWMAANNVISGDEIGALTEFDQMVDICVEFMVEMFQSNTRTKSWWSSSEIADVMGRKNSWLSYLRSHEIVVPSGDFRKPEGWKYSLEEAGKVFLVHKLRDMGFEFKAIKAITPALWAALWETISGQREGDSVVFRPPSMGKPYPEVAQEHTRIEINITAVTLFLDQLSSK